MNKITDEFMAIFLDDVFGEDREESLTSDPFWLENDSILSDDTAKVYDKDYYS